MKCQKTERRDSASSIKRIWEQEEKDETGMQVNDTRSVLREEIEEYLFNENHKISKAAAPFILRR